MTATLNRTDMAARRDTAEDWRLRGACGNEDPELFFPVGETSSTSKRQIEQAKSVCAVCPVRSRCLAEALANSDTYGIWGGTSEDERRKLRRRN